MKNLSHKTNIAQTISKAYGISYVYHSLEWCKVEQGILQNTEGQALRS
jgi:hypothetical protein